VISSSGVSFGEQKNLTDKQVRAAVERSPELSPEDRQKALDNTRKIILASNRRAEITPSNAGQAWQNSVREFPFNAADSLGGTGKATEPGQRKGKA